MAVTPSGTISLADINTATGKSSTAQISMNGTAARCITNSSTGTAISMSQLQNKTCAGGTITVGSFSNSSKGTTTQYYGLGKVGANPTFGSATLGNLTTYPNMSGATSFFQFYCSAPNTAPAYTNWSGWFNLYMPSDPGAFSGRIRVGDNNVMPTATRSLYISSGGFLNSPMNVTNPTGFLTSSQAGLTLDWVISS